MKKHLRLHEREKNLKQQKKYFRNTLLIQNNTWRVEFRKKSGGND